MGTDKTAFSSLKRSRRVERQTELEGFDAPFLGYINVTLTAEQRALFGDWSQSASAWETFAAAITDGINISVKLDPKRDCYLASGTQRRRSSPNAGLVVTARGSEAYTALFRLLFVLAYLSRSERWEDTQPVADPDRW